MAYYSVTNSTNLGAAQLAVTTTDITIVSLQASTAAPSPVIQLRRSKVYDLLVGTVGTPVDFSVYWSIQRCTAGSTPAYTGYASSVALALDQADSVTALAVVANSCQETQYVYTATTAPWYVGVNSRASYRWVAAPGSEIVSPATASAGIGLRVKSASMTNVVTGTVMWSE